MFTLRSIMLLAVLAATPLCAADETLDTAPIVSALIDLTKDADPQVRYAAFEALAKQPRSELLLDVFWRGLEDDLLEIRRLSLDKIVVLEGPTVRVLTRVTSWQEKKPNDVAEKLLAKAAREHLIAFGAPAIPYLIEALKRDEANLNAVLALGQIPLGEYQTTVTTQLTALLKSENKYVRLAAVRSLQSIMSAEAKAKAESKVLAEGGGVDPRYLAYYSKLLQKYDSNQDGSLTEEEWSRMSKSPAEADTDGDGRITTIELAKWSMRR